LVKAGTFNKRGGPALTASVGGRNLTSQGEFRTQGGAKEGCLGTSNVKGGKREFKGCLGIKKKCIFKNGGKKLRGGGGGRRGGWNKSKVLSSKNGEGEDKGRGVKRTVKLEVGGGMHGRGLGKTLVK